MKGVGVREEQYIQGTKTTALKRLAEHECGPGLYISDRDKRPSHQSSIERQTQLAWT